MGQNLSLAEFAPILGKDLFFVFFFFGFTQMQDENQFKFREDIFCFWCLLMLWQNTAQISAPGENFFVPFYPLIWPEFDSESTHFFV